ncbi:MAG: dihydrodipicolinate reductase [Blastocatellia bacterium]|nr:dihydrodipicolinate reductase [Blastocatellia bacterium]
MRLALIGYGRMGKLIAGLAPGSGHSVVVTVNESHSGLGAADLAETLQIADVAIDFTAAYAVRRNVEACVIAKVPIVVGTTGWNDEKAEIEKIVADRDGSLVYGSNFSIGVNLYYRVVEHAAELFSKFPEYEVFIEEQHHSRKKDAPSGTALELKRRVSRFVDEELEIASTRAGGIPGTHRVGFDGSAEQILLEHAARSRECFAIGAVLAAEWIVGKTGIFEFSEVVDEMIGKRK